MQVTGNSQIPSSGASQTLSEFVRPNAAVTVDQVGLAQPHQRVNGIAEPQRIEQAMNEGEAGRVRPRGSFVNATV